MLRRTWMMVILAMTMVFTLGGNPPSDFKPGLYGTAQSLNQLVRINPNGTWSTVLSVVDLPNGLAFRDSNTVYVTADGPNWPSPSAPMVAYQSDGSVVFTVNIPVTNQWPNGRRERDWHLTPKGMLTSQPGILLGPQR